MTKTLFAQTIPEKELYEALIINKGNYRLSKEFFKCFWKDLKFIFLLPAEES